MANFGSSKYLIDRETIERILDSAKIEEVVGEFVTLKKRGVNLIGLCPFHNEKTPSFTVSPSKNLWKCFGCGKGGRKPYQGGTLDGKFVSRGKGYAPRGA